MAKQLFINNFSSQFVAAVRSAPQSGSPATELGYGILQIAGTAATHLAPPASGDFYVLTACKRVDSVETNIEVMKVTAVDSTTYVGEVRITVERAQEGTEAQAYVVNDYVSLRLTKGGAEGMLQARSNLADLVDAAQARSSLGLGTAAQQAASSFEPAVSGDGSTGSFWSGAKTWRNLAVDVRAVVLTGISTAANTAITAADTVLGALGKLQAQLANHIGTGGATHPAATTGVAGFMAASDKTKLDGVAANASAVANVNGTALGVASPGSASTAARSDHVHPLPTKADVGLGNVDNTSDANKPISNLTASALAAKQATLLSGANIKTVNGESLLGAGNMVVSGATYAESTGANNNTDLVAFTHYAVDATTAHTRYLPASPTLGDRVVLLDARGHFANSVFTLRCRSGSHSIRGQGVVMAGTDPLVFNKAVPAVTLEYASPNVWICSGGLL